MESGLLLDITGSSKVTKVVIASVEGNLLIRKSAAILQLLSSKDQSLLVGRDSEGKVGERSTAGELDKALPFLILYFGLNIVNGVRGFDLEGDGFTREATQTVRTEAWRRAGKRNSRFYKDLHAYASYLSSETNGGIVDESVDW